MRNEQQDNFDSKPIVNLVMNQADIPLMSTFK